MSGEAVLDFIELAWAKSITYFFILLQQNPHPPPRAIKKMHLQFKTSKEIPGLHLINVPCLIMVWN